MNASSGPPETSRLAERLLVDHQAILRDLAQARPGGRIAADIAELVRRHTDALGAILVLTPPGEQAAVVVSRTAPAGVRELLEQQLLQPEAIATMPIRQGAGPIDPHLEPGVRRIATHLVELGVRGVWRSALHDAGSRRTGALILLFDRPRDVRSHEQLAVDLTADLVTLLSERSAAGDLAEFRVTVTADCGARDDDRLVGILNRHVGRGGRVAAVLMSIGQAAFDRGELDGDIGDALMANVLRRVRRELDPGTTIVRIGTEVFAAVIPRLDPEGAAAYLSARLDVATAEPVQVMGRSVNIRLAVGAAIEGIAVGDAEHLAHAARLALARARTRPMEGRLRLVISHAGAPDDHPGAPPVVHPDNGMWEVHLQPVVNLSDGRFTGAEAFLCWHDPERGPVPLEHLPESDEAHITEAAEGRLLLARAVEIVGRLQDDGLLDDDFVLCVPATPGLLEVGAPPEVLDLITHHGRTPGGLLLELDPRASSPLDPRVRAVLDDYATAGVRLALAGFGVDSASVRMLEDLPVDTVRIDHCLVGSLRSDGSGSPLAAWAIRMARERGRSTVATGVETEAQYRGLHRLGCTAGQGHHLAPPLDETDFLSLLKEQRLTG